MVGFQFDKEAPPDDNIPEKKFIMRTFDKNTSEMRRDVYEEGQIKVGFSFDDGPVIYVNDKVPELDRKGLGWDENLVGKTLTATWIVQKVKKTFDGYVDSYDHNSEKHTVKWDDGNSDSFDVMGTWQKGMLPMIEWRLCDEDDKKVPPPAIPVSARDKRARNKGSDDGDNIDLTSNIESCATGEKRLRACPTRSDVGANLNTGKRVKKTIVKCAHSSTMLSNMRDKGCLSCLDPKQWLDDYLIDFCLKYLCEATLNKKDSLVSKWELSPLLEPFEFSVIISFAITFTELGKPKENIVIGGWQNLSEKLPEFLVFPINYDSYHWSAAIVWLVNEGPRKCSPCILYLDSCKGNEDAAEKKGEAIRIFLNYFSGAETYTRENLPLFPVKVPKQENGYDCGLFMLHMIYLFLMSSNKRSLALQLKEGKKENWFEPAVPSQLRPVLRKEMVRRFAELPPAAKPSEKKRLRNERAMSTAIMESRTTGITNVVSSEEDEEDQEKAGEGKTKRGPVTVGGPLTVGGPVQMKSLEQVMRQPLVLLSDEDELESAAGEPDQRLPRRKVIT